MPKPHGFTQKNSISMTYGLCVGKFKKKGKILLL